MSDSGKDSASSTPAAGSSNTSSSATSATNSPTTSTTRLGTASATGGSSSSTRIGSLHTTPSVPGARLSSLRGAKASTASTRGGAAKIKFTPTVPTKRNKKDAAPSLLEEARAGSSSDSTRGGRGRGGERGRGRGGGRGGRGRGFEEVAATASGPFSLGPSAQNRWASRRQDVRSGGSASGAHSSYTGVQSVKIEQGDDSISNEDRDYYGDAAVDMKFGSGVTDETMPTGVQGDDEVRVKREMTTRDGEYDTQDDDIKPKIEGPAQDLLPTWQEDQTFFFQFPSVVPRFKPRPLPAMMEDLQLDDTTNDGTPSTNADETDPELIKVKSEPQDSEDVRLNGGDGLLAIKKEEQEPKLGNASGTTGPPAGQRAKPKVAPGGAAASKTEEEDDALSEAPLAQEGKIGRLLVYKSGKVKMQVGEIVMDVTTGSECTFLQDLVVIDSSSKQAFVMGSVQKRMVCVPNLEQLLGALENDQTDL